MTDFNFDSKPDSLTDYDILIIGGGLVGGSLACALLNSSIRIAVIEATEFDSEQQASFDSRFVALSYGSKQIFQGIGLWSKMEKLGVAAINSIEVSDRGHLGATHLSASQHLSNHSEIDALGYVIENRILGQVIKQQLSKPHDNEQKPAKTNSNVHYYCPATLQSLDFSPSSVTAKVNCENKLYSIRARLVIAADGGNSKVRELTATPVSKREYSQCAIIANVSMQYEHNNIAYERFTNSGPFAMLPTAVDSEGKNNVCSMVWTINAKQQQELTELSDQEFIKRLEIRFGNRLGSVTNIGKRFIYPLSLIQVQNFVQHRLVFIGNAAHTLHPVAGQGFNLGLRDVAIIAEILSDAISEREDPGVLEVLNRYAKWRKRDHRQAVLITDSLVKIFSTDFMPIVIARNIGLMVTEVLPPIKNILTRHAIGLAGKLPRLARQLKL